jgi:type IV pilus assembly protein PilA
MKTLQKGFSLVELLVVVAIIGVLAGVGIVGYQGYTDSAKERVAIANFNSVKRFAETELTLLNNNIQTKSAAINAFLTSCTLSVVPYNNAPSTTALKTTNNFGAFLQGIGCYFDATDGYGSAFKNPYDGQSSQVVINKTTNFKQGEINIRLITVAEHTALLAAGVVVPDETASTFATEDGTKRHFLITYITKNDAGNNVEATAGELKGQYFFLN